MAIKIQISAKGDSKKNQVLIKTFQKNEDRTQADLLLETRPAVIGEKVEIEISENNYISVEETGTPD